MDNEQPQPTSSSSNDLTSGTSSACSPTGGSNPDWGNLDLEDALEAVGGEKDVLTELMDEFQGESAALLRDIRTAADSGDLTQLRRTTHTLKSSLKLFGAKAVAELAQQIETAADSGDVDAAIGQVPKLEAAVAEVRTAMQSAQL